MGNTLSQGIEIPVVIIGAVALLSSGMAVIVSVLSAWISARRADRLPIKNVVLDVVEETQVLNRSIVGTGIVLSLISETLPKVVTGNILYIAGGFSLLGLVIAAMSIIASPKISVLSELDFMTSLPAGAMGVLVTLTGSVVPAVRSKRVKLVKGTRFEQPEDLKVKPITGNIAIEGKNIVRDFRIGEAITRALKDVSLKVLKGEFVSTMGQPGSDGKKLKDYRKQLNSTLGIVGLSDGRKHTPRELSGGQQ